MDEGIVSGNIVVGNTLSLQNKIAAIRAAGPSKLQVFLFFKKLVGKRMRNVIVLNYLICHL